MRRIDRVLRVSPKEVPLETAKFGGLLLERKEPAGVWFAIGWPTAALLGGGGVLALDQIGRAHV